MVPCRHGHGADYCELLRQFQSYLTVGKLCVSILPGAVHRHCTRTAPQSMTTNHGLPWAWGAVRVQPTTMYQGSPDILLGITRDNAGVVHFDCPDCVDYLHTMKSNNFNLNLTAIGGLGHIQSPHRPVLWHNC